MGSMPAGTFEPLDIRKQTVWIRSPGMGSGRKSKVNRAGGFLTFSKNARVMA